ncbi:hypothetical protein [Winogradskyella forsetii]|uniref:hypothetical protein n=1 Tax=Winogradskyella forsetii TaxID=2686077 RepID=UPI0015B7FB0C|nr:hypothetical protein [Winogradskyella forsetii]
MDWDKEKIWRIILVTVIILSGLYMYFGYKDRVEHLKSNNVKYTTAEIIDFNWGAKSPPVFTFIYFIEGQKNKGYHSIDDDLRIEINSKIAKEEYFGKRYILRYSIEKPKKYYELLLDKPLPDSLKYCINCGWDKIPF